MSAEQPIYRSDPAGRPDADFEAGELRHLVPGNRGRMLDQRRTPLTITAVDVDVGMFEVRVEDFEDRGALWQIPFEEVAGHQFERGAPAAGPEQLLLFQDAVARLSAPLRIEADRSARARTEERIGRRRAEARALLAAAGCIPLEPADMIASRTGDARLAALLAEYLNALTLQDMDERFAGLYASNPGSGEMVKGHCIVLAELGLADFDGRAVRSPDLFAGDWTRERRAEHLIARLAFGAELWGSARAPVVLHRVVAERPRVKARGTPSLLSTTPSEQVVRALSSPGTRVESTPLPAERVLMSFVETEALNEPYREAEVVLVASGARSRAAHRSD